jgi:serine/threonine protein kinase
MSTTERSSTSRLGLAPEMIIDGKYHLKRLLGTGGGGEVWEAAEAVDTEAWRSIALKLLRTPASDAGSLGKPAAAKTPGRGAHASASSPSTEPEHDWLHEARAVSQVSCEALPRIHTVGTASLPDGPSTPFIAMELVEGETLEARLSRGPIYWRKALAIARQIAVALDACHQAGVIHCDLKPRNVFLEQVQRRRVLVLDFGVASLGGVVAAAPRQGGEARSSDETDVQEPDSLAAPDAPAPPPIVGTPGYISPERLTGLLPDHRDDAFALGVVLHRMIAGRLPQRLPRGAEAISSAPGHKSGYGAYDIGLHRATVERTFEPLSEAAPATPSAVAALVDTLLGAASDRPSKGQLARLVDEVYRRPHGRPPVPYAGLEAFGERRMGYLPGRAGDIEPIVRRLEEQVALVLCGPSGAGKSSLAVAGVAARIDEEMLLDREGWAPVVLRPSSARGGLSLASEDAPPAPATVVAAANKKLPVGSIVVVDQLEELLSLSEGDRRAFCNAFLALVTRSAAVIAADRRIEPDDAVRVVATVRDDLFGRVAALPELARHPERNLYVVRGVDPNAARAIVLDPLEGTGYALELASDVDVVADVARELEHDPSALPLVQFALARLWDRRDQGERVLRARSWKDIGGIVGALGEAAQGLYEGLSPGEQQAARRLFLALFDIDGTRNVVEESALDPAAVALVPRWVAEGLVRRRIEEDGRAVIEPLHEALAKGWSQLGRWLEEVRADRELARDAQRDAKRWERNGQPVDMLWGGTLLQHAEVLRGIEEEPGRAFVAASLAAAARAKRRAFWVNRVLPAAVFGVVLAIVLTGWWLTTDANKKLDSALEQSKVSEHAAKASEQKAMASEARAKVSEEAALQQSEVADRERAKAENLGKEYEQKFKTLDEAVETAIREQNLKKLEAAKRDIDQNRLEPSPGFVPKPPSTVKPPMPDPFE